MLVTLPGMVMLVRLLHQLNAIVPMLVTPFGMAYEVSALPSGYFINSVLSLLKRTPFTLEYTVLAVSTFICFNLLQPLNAERPMLVTLFGMVILVRLLQS